MKVIERIGPIARAAATGAALSALSACDATPLPIAPVAAGPQDNNAASTKPAPAEPSAKSAASSTGVTPHKYAGPVRWCAESRMPSVAGSPPPEDPCEATREACERVRMLVRVPLGECERRGGE